MQDEGEGDPMHQSQVGLMLPFEIEPMVSRDEGGNRPTDQSEVRKHPLEKPWCPFGRVRTVPNRARLGRAIQTGSSTRHAPHPQRVRRIRFRFCVSRASRRGSRQRVPVPGPRHPPSPPPSSRRGSSTPLPRPPTARPSFPVVPPRLISSAASSIDSSAGLAIVSRPFPNPFVWDEDVVLCFAIFDIRRLAKRAARASHGPKALPRAS